MHHRLSAICLAICLICSLAAVEQAVPLVKSGQTVLVLGDSITAMGDPAGWVSMVRSGLAANRIEVKLVNAGASGANSDTVLANLVRHLPVTRPDLIILNSGVNDAKGYGNALPIAKFQENTTAMVEQAVKAKVRILLWTTTAWESKQPTYAAKQKQVEERNAALVPYNEHLRQLAQKRGLPLVDVNAAFTKELAGKREAGDELTVADGVHLAPGGQLLVARMMLRGLGLGKEACLRAEEQWKADAQAAEAKAKAKPKP